MVAVGVLVAAAAAAVVGVAVKHPNISRYPLTISHHSDRHFPGEIAAESYTESGIRVQLSSVLDCCYCQPHNANAMRPALLLLNLALLGSAIALPLKAQIAPQPSLTPTLQAQADENVDTALLVNSLLNFVRADRYQTQSEAQVNVTCQGVNTVVNARLNVIAQYRDRLRAEIEVQKEDGTPDFTMLVVVRGSDVWQYRRDRQQYATLSLPEFQQTGHGLLLGLSNIFFLETQASIKDKIGEGLSPTDEILEDLIAGAVLSQTESTSQTAEYAIYNLKDNNDMFSARFFVRPGDETLQQIEMTFGLIEEQSITMVDKMISRQANPPVDENTFSFSPTPEMTEVSYDQLYPVNLFGDDCV